jgi:catechol 2,3-dioxygenase-like lactoylglutathione lyase family enzyme
VELVEVVLYVRDMERAIRFYRDTVGLELDFESEHWTTFRTGACTLALYVTERREPGSAEPDPTFLAANVEAERARLTGAGVGVTEIRGPVPGTRVFDADEPAHHEHEEGRCRAARVSRRAPRIALGRGKPSGDLLPRG